MPGEYLTITDSTCYINKLILCPYKNDIHYISKEAMNTLDGQVKILSVHSVDCKDKGNIFQHSQSNM